MGGLDSLLAKSLVKTIRDNLGEKTSQKIEERLFEKYGISITQSMEQFQKIDAVLREFFGAGADGLEKKFLSNICKTKTKSKTSNWFTIEDNAVNQTILESYGEDDKIRILNCVSDEPKIISEILSDCKIPQTSGYRKINSLINDGLLKEDGSLIAHDKSNQKMFERISRLMAWVLEHDNNGVVKHEACYQIAARNMRSLIPDLIHSALHDESVLTKHEAIESLGLMRAFEAEELIKDALKDPSPDVRETAEFVIKRLLRIKELGQYNPSDIV